MRNPAFACPKPAARGWPEVLVVRAPQQSRVIRTNAVSRSEGRRRCPMTPSYYYREGGGHFVQGSTLACGFGFLARRRRRRLLQGVRPWCDRRSYRPLAGAAVAVFTPASLGVRAPAAPPGSRADASRLRALARLESSVPGTLALLP